MKRSATLFRYGGFVFSLGAARLAGVLLSSLTFPYLVRHLGVEIYGLWSYVIAVCVFLNNLSNPGLSVYATQQVAAHRQAAFELIPDILALRVLATLPAIGILVGLYFFDKRADVRHLLLLYGFGILLINLSHSDYLLGALEMFHARSLITIAQQALYAVGVFLFVKGPRDVSWVPISILVSALAQNIAGWVLLVRQGFRLPLRIHPERWKGILVPSIHYAGSSLMSSLYHRAGHIAVRWFLGPYALGLYAAAVRFVDIVQQFVTIIFNVLMPRMALSAKSEAELTRLTRIAVTVIAMLNVPLMAGLISTSHIIVPWVLGAKYVEDISLLRWMSPYLLAAPASSLLAGTILYATGWHRAYMVATTSGAVVGLVSYLILIPTLGLNGAGIAFVLGQCVVAATAYALLPAQIRDLWRNPLIGVAAIASILMMAVLWLVSAYHFRPWEVLAIGASVYCILSFWPFRKWAAEEFAGA
jgi:polysaccharide transporter, PST family